MATISKRVCDRCKNEIIKKKGLEGLLKIKRQTILFRVVSGVNHVREIELCHKCTEALDVFLSGEEEQS
ncbi:hypothetical protein [Paenibacillus sp. UASWS1643]|uniref:hypothetical protein n=1 Tax=Paenibacillus sp. UASWS1643 TaxID=2580422 RepID=UPI0012393CFB|nr:hypothetical protein [Paenibacillus sp. UASWS1643]KAA8747133.1 hypothetical protein FE296_23390 [Paenibacillus sp. UASWS1643]